MVSCLRLDSKYFLFVCSRYTESKLDKLETSHSDTYIVSALWSGYAQTLDESFQCDRKCILENF